MGSTCSMELKKWIMNYLSELSHHLIHPSYMYIYMYMFINIYRCLQQLNIHHSCHNTLAVLFIVRLLHSHGFLCTSPLTYSVFIYKSLDISFIIHAMPESFTLVALKHVVSLSGTCKCE